MSKCFFFSFQSLLRLLLKEITTVLYDVVPPNHNEGKKRVTVEGIPSLLYFECDCALG